MGTQFRGLGTYCNVPSSSTVFPGESRRQLGEAHLTRIAWPGRRSSSAWKGRLLKGIISVLGTQSGAAKTVRIRCGSCESNETEPPKEESVLYRRTVYDHKDWMRHRSSLRHSRHILSMGSSRVILALGPPVCGLTFVAACLAAYNEIIMAHWLPSWFPLLHVSAIPFQLMAPALALLLVFRTNASYARFDEARRAWGSNVNRTRDLCRQALSWIQQPSDTEKLKKLLRHSADLDQYQEQSRVSDSCLQLERRIIVVLSHPGDRFRHKH